METVYLETSFVSYLVAEPSRDEITAQRQDVSRRWWELRRTDFQCVVSSAVLDEIAEGDAVEIAKRQLAIAPYPILLSTPASQSGSGIVLGKRIAAAKGTNGCVAHCNFRGLLGGFHPELEFQTFGE